jgi:hypothetical protein
MVKGAAAHIKELTCYDCTGKFLHPLSETYLSNISLDKVTTLTSLMDFDEPIPLIGFQLSLLRGCCSRLLTTLELSIPGIKFAQAIPINLLRGLKSLRLAIGFAPQSTIRIHRFATQLQTWLSNASQLEHLTVKSRFPHRYNYDTLILCLLSGSESDSDGVCNSLQRLELFGGNICFPEILHKVFMERTHVTTR